MSIGTRTEEIDELVRGDCRAAIAALERAIQAPPLRVSQEADLAEREVVRARDAVIAHLRQNQNGESDHLHAILDQLNAVLSLVVAIEYPMSGVQRHLMEQARDALLKLADGTFS